MNTRVACGTFALSLALMAEVVDVRGYYHGSLMDNFQWSEGDEPRLGLYRVDLDTYERTATKGAEVLREIAHVRGVTQAQLGTYGGDSPMHPEEAE
jgi:beta-glucosidase